MSQALSALILEDVAIIMAHVAPIINKQGQTARDRMVRRMRVQNTDRFGKKMHPYSRKYAKRKGTDRVTLRASGDMHDAIVWSMDETHASVGYDERAGRFRGSSGQFMAARNAVGRFDSRTNRFRGVSGRFIAAGSIRRIGPVQGRIRFNSPDMEARMSYHQNPSAGSKMPRREGFGLSPSQTKLLQKEFGADFARINFPRRRIREKITLNL